MMSHFVQVKVFAKRWHLHTFGENSRSPTNFQDSEMLVKMLYLHWVEGTPQLCPFPHDSVLPIAPSIPPLCLGSVFTLHPLKHCYHSLTLTPDIPRIQFCAQTWVSPMPPLIFPSKVQFLFQFLFPFLFQHHIPVLPFLYSLPCCVLRILHKQ